MTISKTSSAFSVDFIDLYRVMRQRFQIKLNLVFFFFSSLFRICLSVLKKDRLEFLKLFVFLSVQSSLQKGFSIYNSARVIIKPPLKAVLEHKQLRMKESKESKFSVPLIQ